MYRNFHPTHKFKRRNPINSSRLRGVITHALLDTDPNEAAAFTRLSVEMLTRIEKDDLDELNICIGQLVEIYEDNQPAMDKLQAIFDEASQENTLLREFDLSARYADVRPQQDDAEWYAATDAMHPWADTGFGKPTFLQPGQEYKKGWKAPEMLVASRLDKEDINFYAQHGYFEKPLFVCHGSTGPSGTDDFAFNEARENGKGQPYLAILKFTGGLVSKGLGSVQEFHEEFFEGGARHWWYEISPRLCKESGADLVLGDSSEDSFMGIVCNQRCVDVITIMTWEEYHMHMGIAALEGIASGKISEKNAEKHSRWLDKATDEDWAERFKRSDKLNWYENTVDDMLFSSSRYTANKMINRMSSSKYKDYSISKILGRAKKEYEDTKDRSIPDEKLRMISQQFLTYHPQVLDYQRKREDAFEAAQLIANGMADPLDAEFLFLVRYFWYQDSNNPADIVRHCLNIVRRGLPAPHNFENTGFLEADEAGRKHEIQFVLQFLDEHGTRYRNFWIIHPQFYRGGYVCKIDEGFGPRGSGSCWHTIPPLPTPMQAVEKAKEIVDIQIALGERRSSTDVPRTDEQWFNAWRYIPHWVRNEMAFLEIADRRYDWEIDYRRKYPEEFIGPKGLPS